MSFLSSSSFSLLSSLLPQSFYPLCKQENQNNRNPTSRFMHEKTHIIKIILSKIPSHNSMHYQEQGNQWLMNADKLIFGPPSEHEDFEWGSHWKLDFELFSSGSGGKLHDWYISFRILPEEMRVSGDTQLESVLENVGVWGIELKINCLMKW